jgi:hypothetical protein
MATQTPPTFPFAASTIIATRPNTILLKFSGWHEEAVSDDTGQIYPGMVLQLQSDGGVIRHATPGGAGELLVAKEDALQGHWFQDPYNQGDLVSYGIPKTGDEILFLVNAGAAAITQGQGLMSAGDGTVAAYGGVGGTNLYTQVGDSAPVSNTVAETPFNKTYTLPANTLQKVGDTLRLRGRVDGIAVTGTPTLEIRVKAVSGATTPVTVVLLDSTALTVPTGNVVSFDITLTVQAVGVAGSITGSGSYTTGALGAGSPVAVTLPLTTFDTVDTEMLEVTAQWSVAAPANTCLLREFIIDAGRVVTSFAVAKESVNNSAGATMAYIVGRIGK